MSSKAYAYYKAGLTEKERNAELASLGSNQSYVIHYTESKIRFEKWQNQPLLATGQAFNAAQEIRWWPLNDRFELLIVADAELKQRVQAGWEQHPDFDCQESQGQTSRIYLFGTHWNQLAGSKAKAQKKNLDGWRQAGIQAELHYPIDNPSETEGAVEVRTRTYRRNGVPCLTRFVSIGSTRLEEVSDVI
jgi:hypothetical protein